MARGWVYRSILLRNRRRSGLNFLGLSFLGLNKRRSSYTLDTRAQRLASNIRKLLTAPLQVIQSPSRLVDTKRALGSLA
jgi:hypothetical protein